MYALDSKKYPDSKDSRKCGKCNWETPYFYLLANSKKEAIKLLKDENAGLCGECMSIRLVDNPYVITVKRRLKA